jgi:hypothetical protein
LLVVAISSILFREWRKVKDMFEAGGHGLLREESQDPQKPQNPLLVLRHQTEPSDLGVPRFCLEGVRKPSGKISAAIMAQVVEHLPSNLKTQAPSPVPTTKEKSRTYI